MPKKVLFESAVHQFVSAGQAIVRKWAEKDPDVEEQWRAFLRSLRFTYPRTGILGVAWEWPSTGRCEVSFREAAFYTRGDSRVFAERQRASKTPASEDVIQEGNEAIFARQIISVARLAGVPLGNDQ